MRSAHRNAKLLTIGALLLLGCGSSTASTNGDDSTGSDATASDGAGPTDTPPYGRPTPCETSADCEEGESCVAPYDPAGGIGEPVCVEGCIEEENDLGLWCMDDAACCGDLRCHEVDGFCEPPVDDGPTDSGSSTGADTDSASTSTAGSGSTDTTTTGSGSTDTTTTASGSTGTSSGSGSTGTNPTGSGSTGTSSGSDTGTSGQGTTSATMTTSG